MCDTWRIHAVLQEASIEAPWVFWDGVAVIVPATVTLAATTVGVLLGLLFAALSATFLLRMRSILRVGAGIGIRVAVFGAFVACTIAFGAAFATLRA